MIACTVRDRSGNMGRSTPPIPEVSGVVWPWARFDPLPLSVNLHAQSREIVEWCTA